MYCQYFGLTKKPFQISSDNEFLWLGKAHGTALNLLKKGMEQEQGLLILIGDIGTGKTTLINEITQTLDKTTRVVRIEDPGFELHALFEVIARGLGFEEKRQEKFSSGFLSFLKESERIKQKVLVVVDESQRIPKRFLREILSWSQFKLSHVLTVLLAGQLEMQEVLGLHLGRAWPDHVLVSLIPLDLEDTRAYISRRLEIAGARKTIFLDTAVREIHAYSKGIPRVINIACDQALIQAFADDKDTIDGSTVKKALLPLELPLINPPDHIPGAGKDKEEPGAVQDPDFPKRAGKTKKIAAVLMAAGIFTFAGVWLYQSPVFTDKKPLEILMDSLPEQEQPTEGSPEEHPSMAPGKNPESGNPTISEDRSVQKEKGEFVSSSARIVEKQVPGLGYTPATKDRALGPEPVLNQDQSTDREVNPELTAVPVKTIHPILPDPLETESVPSGDMESFIQKVFLSEEKKAAFMEANIEIREQETALSKDLESETPRGQPGAVSPPASPDGREERSRISSDPDPDAVIDWLLKKRAAGHSPP